MLEVHVAEGGERLGPRLHDEQDPLPRLDGERLVAVLEVVVAEVDEVARVARRGHREPLQHLERLVLLADAPIEVGDAREDLFVARRRAPRAFGHELHGPRAVPALHERVALFEHERRVVRRCLDEPFVLGDGFVQITVRLKQANHPEADVDLPRADGERLLVRVDGLLRVARLFVEAAEQREAREVGRVLVLELLHELGQALVGAVDLGDDLVDLGPQRALLPRHGERPLERRQRRGVLVRLGLRVPQLLQRGRERAVVPGRRGDDVLQLRLGLRVLAAVVQLATELALHEEARRLERHELLVRRLRRRPVLLVERDGHDAADRLLLVGLRREQRQRLLVAGARLGEVPPVLVEARERLDRHGIRALDGDGLLVGLDGVVGAAVDLVEAREGDGRRVLVGARLRRARLEVDHQLRDVAVALAVELRQALERKRGARLRQGDARVALDEHGLRGARRLVRLPAGSRGRPVAPCRRPASARAQRRPVMPTGRVEVLRTRRRRRRHGRGERQRDHGEHAGGAHSVSLDAKKRRRTWVTLNEPMAFFQAPPVLGNQYLTDRTLRSLLGRQLPGDVLRAVEPELELMGELAAGPLFELQQRCRGMEPRLVAWDAWGNRVDTIELTPLWQEAARVAAEKGVVSTAYERKHGEHSRIHQFALAYLFDGSTEVYTCPLAMTDGAAKTLLVHGNRALIDRALPRLTSRDPARAWTSGQWMTERTGGSDVAISETVARKDGSAWRLFGTKWFTSASTSQMALALARPEGNPPGGSGLALFYVETRDEGGRLRDILVNRLKDKLGTRMVPTAELTLDGTPAIAVWSV